MLGGGTIWACSEDEGEVAGTCFEEDELSGIYSEEGAADEVACQNEGTAFLKAERSTAHSSGQVCCKAPSGSTEIVDDRELACQSLDVPVDELDCHQEQSCGGMTVPRQGKVVSCSSWCYDLLFRT